LPNVDVIASLFKLNEQVAILVRSGSPATGNAAVVIGGTMLADVFVCGAVGAAVVGRQFREEGEDDALFVPAEDDDGGVH
jgi:hypothetical protein